MRSNVKRVIGRGISALLAVAFLAAITGWGVLAIYYGDSHTNGLRTLIAVLFGLAGLTALVGIFVRRWRVRFTGAFLALFAAVLAWWWIGVTPSNARDWQSDVAKLPYATIQGDLVTVHNVRNFAYRTETDFSPAWYTRTYDLRELDSVDLYAIYWMGPAIAHTIVSFGFGGRDFLAVSIEARKEQNEGYSSIKGFFRQYELIYVAADERDVIRLRTNYRNNPPEDVYLYRVQGSPDAARRFFLSYIEAINDLKERPRFYNTLTANCTNVIWMHAHVNPGRVPFSWKILASGYAPEYLYGKGRLDTAVPFDELRRRGHINRVARAADDAPDFSRKIRAGVPGTTPRAFSSR